MKSENKEIKAESARPSAPQWLECTWRREPCGRSTCKVCRSHRRPSAVRLRLWRGIDRWHREVGGLAERAFADEELWLDTEEAADVLWYAGVLRNHVHMSGMLGKAEADYARYVTAECLRILESAFSELIKLQTRDKAKFLMLLSELQQLKGAVLAL